MSHKIPIYTLQFLDIPFNEENQLKNAERVLFLNFITKHVFEIALKNQSLFKAVGCDAEYFHKDKNFNNKIPKIINCFIKDEVLTIRAYTKKGIETLKFWFKLYQKIHPKNCINVRFSKESYIFKTEKPIKNNECLIYHYTSTNWIAFDKITHKHNQYLVNKELATFKSTLIGHLRTFLEHIGMDTKPHILAFKIENIPTQHTRVMALKTNNKPITQLCFKIQFSTNYKLPSLFSMGKKVVFGFGVFIKDPAKTQSYDPCKINPKSTEME